ncbi:trehalose-phosphatase [Zunongwangia sp. F363]|uniref:Trehalose 6-phosphate phosphatase n=1 Tax=Autumnicola tepida TaxID=3075595 RepID=A0ABU3CC04_9FLAO|nr:trehalose-phosphatase [Zunongwangia sp. F363]MDT0643860.1 trehalose-phosphatase [Zunongwangia sp. F363]
MSHQLPSALEHGKELREKFNQIKPLLFLDFDGTLAPIVEHHEDAAISAEMRDLVLRLSKKYPTAVVSGRGMKDVSQRVNIPELYYAGSHGFEISGPGNFLKENDEAQKVLPQFDEIETSLRKELKDINGVDFERKKFTLAIHYRQVKEEMTDEVHQRVATVLKKYPELKKADGKKVIEIRPSIDWHKGKAVEFLKTQLGEKDQDYSVYIGDDVTDEDAFKYVQHGLGILVGDHGHETSADYALKDLDEVKQFFELLLQ